MGTTVALWSVGSSKDQCYFLQTYNTKYLDPAHSRTPIIPQACSRNPHLWNGELPRDINSPKIRVTCSFNPRLASGSPA